MSTDTSTDPAPLYNIEETMESLTGYDEIAIAKTFDMEWGELAKKKPSMFTRALLFVLRRREGLTDAQAKEAALSLTIGAVNDLFDTEDDDESPVGKGEE